MLKNASDVVWVCEKGHVDDHHYDNEPDQLCSRCGGKCQRFSLDALAREYVERLRVNVGLVAENTALKKQRGQGGDAHANSSRHSGRTSAVVAGAASEGSGVASHTCDPENPCEPNGHLCKRHRGSGVASETWKPPRTKEDSERVTDAANAATRAWIDAEVAAAEIVPVPDGGFQGTADGGRLSATGDTPEKVQVRLGRLLEAEEEDEASGQRWQWTGLRILAAKALPGTSGDDKGASR